jgi:hypothetical protein
MTQFDNVVETHSFALLAPGGYVHGTFGLSRREAETLLVDRVANGEAFPGERVSHVCLHVRIDSDGSVAATVAR